MNPKKNLFINRELSWLDFNQRVLDEALNPNVPLLERLNFLTITASNLDEFFMVRVGGLQLMAASGMIRKDPCGMSPVQQMEAVAQRVYAMVNDQYNCYRHMLEPALAQEGIVQVRRGDLSAAQRRHLQNVFDEEIYPVLTPMRVEATDRFPLLRNLGLHLAVRLKPDPAREDGKPRFAVIPLPPHMRRLVALPTADGFAWIAVEETVRMFVERFFPGESVMEVTAFRITRNADLDAREDFAADFLAEMKTVLDRRKNSGSVRLELAEPCSRILSDFLRKALRVAPRDLYMIPDLVHLGALSELTGMEGFDHLRYAPWPPQASPQVESQKSLFEQIARNDILLLHPYDSFEPVLRFLQEAARDPHVLAVKQTLYRTSADSPVIAALQEAAENGKAVTALVELKARFDEARNIDRARDLEKAGAQVIYGVKGLKTHSKICLVVRREPHGIVRYLHLGTGNYNEKTARIYSDLSLFTCHADFGADASSFFNAICGYSEPRDLLKLCSAPFKLRETLLDLIHAETERARKGQKALIMAKVNSLADPDMIRALYRASQAGVEVRLNVRGICCLKPGVRGLSDNISVLSIVDRFLEHARLFLFHAGGERKIFMSSADWMPRNLNRRIELLIPVEDPACHARAQSILQTYFTDTVKASRILPVGGYEAVLPAKGKKGLRSQEILYRNAVAAARQEGQSQRTTLAPLRPLKKRKKT